jgi:regulatory protein
MNVKEVKEKAMQWCSRKECCRKEIFDKAVSWGCSLAEAGELVAFLVEQKFVDERRYTEAYVKDKLQFNKWGRIKIAYMLRPLNIDNDIVVGVLSEIDETEYLKILTGELQKKHKTLHGNDAFETKEKLFRFGVNRGFEPEIISKIISKMVFCNI